MAYNFQTGNKIKLLPEYENVAQKKFLLPIESVLQNAARFCFIVSGLKITKIFDPYVWFGIYRYTTSTSRAAPGH